MTKYLFLVVVTALSSCATYQPAPIERTKLIQSFESRTLHDPALQRHLAAHLGKPSNRWPPDAWDLTSLSLAAFYFSPALDLGRAKLGTSQAVVLTAAMRPNPSLQFPFGYKSNTKAGESAYTFGLGLDIPIETAGKRGYRIAQAEQLSRVARFNIGDIAWQVRSQLRTDMLDLYRATRGASIVEKQIDTQHEILAMLVKRQANGAASAPEVNQAQIDLDQRQLDLADWRRRIIDARAQMASTIGLPVGATANVNIRFDEFERTYGDIPTDAARHYAVLNRAKLLGALAQYEASQSALQLEIAKQYPDIHIGPGYTFDAGAHKFALPVSGISLPLFNRNEGPIAQAQAQRKEAAARFNALQTQAINDTDRAVQGYRAALTNLHLADALLLSQRRQQQVLQEGLRAGATDRLTLTLAQGKAYGYELAHLDALIRVQQAIGQLEDAMQRPLLATDLLVDPAKEYPS